MKNIAILLTKEPYGLINSAEAVRHALGAVSDDIGVSLLLTGGGALLSSKGQVETGTGFTNLGGALKDCVEMGVSVGVDKDSLIMAKLQLDDIVEGVEVMESSKIAEIVKAADQTMIF